MTENVLKNLEQLDERSRKVLTDLFKELGGDSRKIAGALHIHVANISKLYNATYEGNIEQLVDKAEAFLRKRRRILVDLFIEGETAKNIFNVLNRVRDQSSMALIVGAARRGKTAAVREWIGRQSESFWKPCYVECPPDKSTRSLLVEIAKSMRLDAGGTKRQLTDRIEDRLNSHYILIFDEATRLLQRPDPTESLEVIRRFNDQKEAGIAFIATDWFETHLVSGKHRVYMEQLIGRLEDTLRVPGAVSRGEVRKFLAPHCVDNRVTDDLMKLAMQITATPGKVAALQRHLNDALLLARACHSDTLTVDYLLAAIEQRKGTGLWSEGQ